jgi:hypothetical protein
VLERRDDIVAGRTDPAERERGAGSNGCVLVAQQRAHDRLAGGLAAGADRTQTDERPSFAASPIEPSA